MAKLVFVHGWGYGPDVWDKVISQLSDHECQVLNLGFFGGEDCEQHLIEECIYVGHSLGVLWLLKRMPKNAKGLVSIAGFDDFSKCANPRILRMMAKNLVSDPQKQLRDFWAQCGSPEYSPGEEPNTGRLMEGLEWLGEWNAQIKLERLMCPVYAIVAKDDTIVPEAASKEIWEDYDMKILEEGEHALPITQPQNCVETIRKAIENAV